MKLGFIFRTAVASSMFLEAINANAAIVSCTAVPKKVGTYLSGDILSDLGPGPVILCSTVQTNSGSNTEACKSLYALLLTNASTNSAIRLFFDTTNPSNTGLVPGLTENCADLGIQSFSYHVPLLVLRAN